VNRPSNLQTPTPQIYRHYNKIEIFNEEKLGGINQSISDKHQKSSKSHLPKLPLKEPEDEEDDFEDELDDIVLDRVYNANPSHHKLASRVLSEKEEREMQREIELLHQKKAIALEEQRLLKRQEKLTTESTHSSPSKKGKHLHKGHKH
jgi:hypothetical protein